MHVLLQAKDHPRVLAELRKLHPKVAHSGTMAIDVCDGSIGIDVPAY